MTGNDLLKTAVSMMQETDVDPYLPYALALVNLVLDETFEVNQRILAFSGEEPLAKPPKLGNLAEEIPFTEELSRRALPLGLLCRLYAAEGNNPMLSLYKQEYADAVNRCDKGRMVFETEGSHAEFFRSRRG